MYVCVCVCMTSACNLTAENEMNKPWTGALNLCIRKINQFIDKVGCGCVGVSCTHAFVLRINEKQLIFYWIHSINRRQASTRDISNRKAKA